MDGGGGGCLSIFSATTVTSFASEGEEYDQEGEEGEHSPSEGDDDEGEEDEAPVGFLIGLARFFTDNHDSTLANSEEDDILFLSLISPSLFGIRP